MIDDAALLQEEMDGLSQIEETDLEKGNTPSSIL